MGLLTTAPSVNYDSFFEMETVVTNFNHKPHAYLKNKYLEPKFRENSNFISKLADCTR